MGPTIDEYIMIYTEWTEESLQIKERFDKTSQEIREGIPERMKQPGIDPSEVVFQVMEELRELDRQRQTERDECDKKHRLILEQLRP